MTHALPRKTIRLMLPLLAIPLVSACASADGFPSLARRPAEKGAWTTANAAGTGQVTGSAAAIAPASDSAVTQTPVSDDLPARLAQLQEAARAAHERFTSKRASAAQRVAAAHGSAVASEAWSVATVAVADLESARSDAMVSLGELDRLYVAERIDGGDGVAIAAARDQVTAWVADEDAVLADLGGRLGG